MVSRRTALASLGAAAAATVAAGLGCGSRARGGPCALPAGQPVRWIVPNAPGGGYDSEARLIEPFLERALGAEIAVENVPGAGGLIGARAIASARPDGLTMGSLGMPGLLLASMGGTPEAPDPLRAFSILARVGRSLHVWAAGATSRLHGAGDLFAAASSRPLVFAVNEIGSANMASISVTARLLGLAVELVAGFGGTRAAAMAALRGDVDLVCFDFETLRSLIEDGDLRPVLQVSASPVARHRSLSGVPCLGGDDGLLATAAGRSPLTAPEASETASALFAVMGSGRLVAAPAAVEPGLRTCLSATLHGVLTSGDLQAAAQRPLDPAPGDVALADVRTAAAAAPRLLPILAEAIRRVRS